MNLDPKSKIEAYLISHKLSKIKFVVLCGISHQTLYTSLKRNAFLPSMAQKIEDGTSGEIRYEELCDLPRPKWYEHRIRQREYVQRKNLS